MRTVNELQFALFCEIIIILLLCISTQKKSGYNIFGILRSEVQIHVKAEKQIIVYIRINLKYPGKVILSDLHFRCTHF